MVPISLVYIIIISFFKYCIACFPFPAQQNLGCVSVYSRAFPDIRLLQRFPVKDEAEESFVKGVAWLENKIYVVCRGSNRVHVFPDLEPFNELKNEEIKIKSMKQSWDISTSKVSQSIFISDPGNQCIWRVQMPGREINPCKIEGMPSTLSITSTDKLIVVVERDDRHHLDFHNCSPDVKRIQSITLSTQIKEVLHAIQPSSRNTVISYSVKNFPGVYQISELSTDGKNFLRTFDPRSVRSINMSTWKPDHMTFDPEDGQLFIADYRHFRVYLLSSQLTDPRMLLKRFQHQLDGPSRLCYVQDKQQLIVGQKGFVREPGYVSVFSLCSSREEQGDTSDPWQKFSNRQNRQPTKIKWNLMCDSNFPWVSTLSHSKQKLFLNTGFHNFIWISSPRLIGVSEYFMLYLICQRMKNFLT